MQFVFQCRICAVLVFSGTCVSLTSSRCQFWFLYCVLCSRDTEFLSKSERGLYFHCNVQAFAIFLEANTEIIFTENIMTQKRTDRESARAVREEMFLSRYKSEPGIVESSVSTSSAYCQNCHPWSVAENLKYSNFSKTATTALNCTPIIWIWVQTGLLTASVL